MESALYGIYTLLFCIRNLTRSLRSLAGVGFWYVNNSCVNTVRQHFRWSILYLFIISSLVFCGLSVKKRLTKIMYHKIITDSIGSHVRCFNWKHNVDRTLKSSCLLSVRYQHYGKPPSFLSTYLHQYNFAVHTRS